MAAIIFTTSVVKALTHYVLLQATCSRHCGALQGRGGEAEGGGGQERPGLKKYRFLFKILSKSIDFERQAGPGVSGRFGTSGGSHFRHFPEIIVIQNHRSGRNSDRNLGHICRHVNIIPYNSTNAWRGQSHVSIGFFFGQIPLSADGIWGSPAERIVIEN